MDSKLKEGPPKFDIKNSVQACFEYLNNGYYYELFNKPGADILRKYIQLLSDIDIEVPLTNNENDLIHTTFQTCRYELMDKPVNKLFLIFWDHLNGLSKCKLTDKNHIKELGFLSRLIQCTLTLNESVIVIRDLISKYESIQNQGSAFIDISKHYLKKFDDEN